MSREQKQRPEFKEKKRGLLEHDNNLEQEAWSLITASSSFSIITIHH